MKIQIEQATPDKASHIASLIMEAMTAQCCQNFAGPQHTLVDFHRMMTKLVEMEDSQYSYKNTLVAMSTDGILVGILVAYDGADVKRLRKRFIEAAIVAFGMDYSAMELLKQRKVSSIWIVWQFLTNTVEKVLRLNCWMLLSLAQEN